jgi:hypothetical protein
VDHEDGSLLGVLQQERRPQRWRRARVAAPILAVL